MVYDYGFIVMIFKSHNTFHKFPGLALAKLSWVGHLQASDDLELMFTQSMLCRGSCGMPSKKMFEKLAF